MRHCTVCGTEAREGAKFCTSCGARLQNASTDPISETATLPSVSGEPESPPSDHSETSGTDTRNVDIGTSGPTETYVPEQDEPAEPDTAAGTPYVASWPTTDPSDEPGDQVERTEPEMSSSESSEPASWTSAFVSPEPAQGDPAADDAGTTPEDADPNRDVAVDTAWTWDATQDEPQDEADSRDEREEAPVTEDSWSWSTSDEPASEPGIADDDLAAHQERDADHHGASEWESWAPTAGGPSVLDEHHDDQAGQIRALLNDLADRIDRLVSPSTLASRPIDPDDLADQLDRWSRTVPDTDGLLTVVQDVRKSPRDLDAIARLADRAADLELMVRHYQSITSSSGQWASDIRRERDTGPDGSDA